MTMDRVYNPHQQHGFQHTHQQVIQSQGHIADETNNPNRPTIPQSYRQPRNHPTHHHNPATLQIPPTLHRPIHPPPPPPTSPPNQLDRRYHVSTSKTLEALRQPMSTVIGSIDMVDGHVPVSRHSLQANYLIPNTQQQQQQRHTIHQPFVHLHNPHYQQTLSHDNHYHSYVPSRELGLKEVSNATDEIPIPHNNHTEEVIQAILSAKEALEKPIEERDKRDILLIDNLCSLVHGFDAFPKSVRRALAAQAILIVIDERGKELIVHNEELDSFCVLIFGECEQLNVAKTLPIKTYHVGDAFGICEPTTDTIRFVGHMVTKCENCAFLCVKRDDFYSILTDSANYPSKELARHRDRDGNIVCISQLNIDKKTVGPIWANQLQSSNKFKVILPDGHLIMKATEPYLLSALVDGYDKIDTDYFDDFLLLFRVFMTHDPREKENLPPGMIKLCRALVKWLECNEYKDRVVKIVLIWLSSYYHDFELNSDFSYYFFKLLESRLLNMSMNNQLHLLHVTLSTKARKRQVTITRSSREQSLNFSIGGGYEKNCGIFVTKVQGSLNDDISLGNLVYDLVFPESNASNSRDLSHSRSFINPSTLDSRPVSAILRPGDQILEVNGTNFTAIKLSEAQRKLDMSTHLSLTVKFNPSAFNEMRALPEGKRKSSLSSVSSVSPFLPQSSQNRFTFMNCDQLSTKQSETTSIPSPMFVSNSNFAFKSILKPTSKNDKSKLSSLISTSKQFVKNMRETSVQTALNNIETMSKTSDNISDDQSNEFDFVKAKSNPELLMNRLKDRQLENGLSVVVGLDDLNPLTVVDTNGNNQSLVNVLRVFNAANNESRYLVIHEETTAREVVMVAVREFNLTGTTGTNFSPGGKTVSSLNWQLYEVSVVPESRTIKQKCLSEQTSHLAERASLSSRFYIKNNSETSVNLTKLDINDDALVNEILKESPSNVTLTSLNATLLAVELTLADFDKFKSIEPQQFVYDTFFDYCDRIPQSKHSHSRASLTDSASLKSTSSDGQDIDILHNLNKARTIPRAWMQEYQDFADISNREMFWVVCEILNERNVSRRVKIIKQFIRVADVCSQLRNYNSMFAIISGLGHSCVNRLRRTFDKLKPKYKTQLEKMRCLFDPSRNMSNYRMCLSQSPPPAIPLFPQIKKDLTFSKEGRSIFVRETNDLSDDDEDSMKSFNQDTMKRRHINDQGTYSKTTVDTPLQSRASQRAISRTQFNDHPLQSLEADRILVNFAEIRQFTDRVRNVIYYSSVPYSNELLTNSKDGTRNQAQIKKMHEEWHMRKRIQHYIKKTLNVEGRTNDRLDSGFSRSLDNEELSITYDERVLYQKSLDVEPEINARPTPTTSSANERGASLSVQINHHSQPQHPPMEINMHPPQTLNLQQPSAANSSPTLSKSSSLSSCSSFNHPMANCTQSSRNNFTCPVGKFGTESTESLRKLQSLSENRDDWRSQSNHNKRGSISRLGQFNGKDAQAIHRNPPTSKMFPPKNSR